MKQLCRYCIGLTLLLLCQCSNHPRGDEKQVDETTMNQEQNARNEAAWAEADELVFTETDFLKTTELINEEVIQKVDMSTGEVGNHAYNNRVYQEGILRIEKNLKKEGNRLVVQAQSGKELNMAEDMFQYISGLVEEWNRWVAKGTFVIVEKADGGYRIEPVRKPETEKE